MNLGHVFIKLFKQTENNYAFTEELSSIVEEFFWILSTIIPTAWSPETLQAVPKLSWAIYKAIIKVSIGLLNPKIDSNAPSDAITAPPGTPGAATIEIPNIAIKPAKLPKVTGILLSIITDIAQVVKVIVLPDIWVVAQSGITNSLIPLEVPIFSAHFKLTGMVAAEDWVPKAVRYPGICNFRDLNTFFLLIEHEIVNWNNSIIIWEQIIIINTFQKTENTVATCPVYVILANIPTMCTGSNGIIMFSIAFVIIAWKSSAIFLRGLLLIAAIPKPNKNAKIRAVITFITGGISTLKKGSKSFAAEDICLVVSLVIIKGNNVFPTPYAKKPEIRVNKYAIPTVIPRSLPAPVPSSAIPAVTKPRIRSGTMNPKKLPNIELNVIKF